MMIIKQNCTAKTYQTQDLVNDPLQNGIIQKSTEQFTEDSSNWVPWYEDMENSPIGRSCEEICKFFGKKDFSISDLLFNRNDSHIDH